MYLYFNRNGVLKEIINDESLYQGSANVNTIYVYFESEVLTNSVSNIVSVVGNVKYADNTINSWDFSDVVSKEIPYDANRDLKYFKDGKTYRFHTYTLDGNDLQHNGRTEMTLNAFYQLTPSYIVAATGLVIFNIQESIQPDVEISESQFQYLLGLIASKENAVNKVNSLNDSNTTTFPTTKAVTDVIDTKEDKINKKTTLTNSDTDYPTTRAVVNALNSLTSSITAITNAYVVSAEIIDNELHIVYKSGNTTGELYFQGGANIDFYYTKTEVDNLLDNKVDKVSGKGLSTNDFTTTEKNKLAGIQAGAEVNVNADWNAVSGDAQILNKPTIPTKTSELQNDSDFATESFVNSSVATNTAYFLGTYNLISDLELLVTASHSEIEEVLDDYSTLNNPTNNDYCFVQIPSSNATPTTIIAIERYKYVARTGWQYEYTLNNSSFTQGQWDAINSNITSSKVTGYDSHVANSNIHVTTEDKSTWNAKQDAITASNLLSSSVVSDGTNNHTFVSDTMYTWLDNQLYQAPAISVFLLCNNGNAVNTTQENGSSITFNQIRHQETNIDNISSLTYDNTSITPSSSITTISVNSQTISSNTTITLSGINTHNASFSRNASIIFYNYAYSILSSSTSAPTNGLTRQNTDTNFRINGASFNYTNGDYLYLYSVNTINKVQTYVLGQWTDVTATNIGNITITKQNGTTQSYQCYRVGPFSANGTATYRIT